MREYKTDQTSPDWVFVALFADDVVTRMTIHCSDGVADLKRGITVARAAYKGKTSNSNPPPIVAAKFVEPDYDNTVVEEYDAHTLKAAASAIAEREAREQAEREAWLRAQAARRAAEPETHAEPEEGTQL